MEELGFTPQEISDVRLVFELYDTTKSGWIVLDHLRKALRLLGFKVSRENVQQMASDLQAPDTTQRSVNRGLIDFATFLQVLRKLQGSSYDKYGEIAQAFSYLDIDGDGSLSADDLTRAGGRDVEGMIAEADQTGNGEVSLSEFVAVMMRTVLFKNDTK